MVLWFLVLVAAAFASPARAAGPAEGDGARALHLVSLGNSDAFEQAQALSGALRRAIAQAPGWSLAPGDYSSDVLMLALGCSEPPDTECLERIASKIGAERFVSGTVYRIGKGVRAQLQLWQAEGVTSFTIQYADNLVEAADEALRGVARLALAQLVGLDAGVVKLRTKRQGLRVFWNGYAQQVAPDGTLVLPTGQHELVVAAAGLSERSLRMIVEPGETVVVDVEPPPPVLRDVAPREEKVTEDAADDDSAPGIFSRPVLGYATLGLGVGLTAASIVSALKLRSLEDEPALMTARSALPPSQDACVEARADHKLGGADPAAVRDICGRADTLSVLQWVFLGAGVAGLGGGTYLLLTDSAAPEEEVASHRPRLRTTLTQERAEVELTFSF